MSSSPKAAAPGSPHTRASNGLQAERKDAFEKLDDDDELLIELAEKTGETYDAAPTTQPAACLLMGVLSFDLFQRFALGFRNFKQHEHETARQIAA